jgi:hypothetical protein
VTIHFRLCVLSVIAIGACSKQQAAPPVPADAARPAPAHAPTASAPTASAPPASAEPAGAAITGPVLETMDAASYTYVRVRGASGDVWAAAPQFPVKVGDQVRVPLEMPMKNFHSTGLNRDFPVIYFVTKISSGDGAAAAAAPAAQAPADPHGGMRTQTASVTTPMPAPAGGMTIASLWAGRKTLAGQPVTVHGVVVKFNPGILGKNWIHLQDGTGKAADGSNDVTVTSTEDVAVKVGDTIVVSGTAVVDKNIGDGYMYPVLVENARVSVQKTAGS